jgi:iron complex outermembrane receptor protein
MYLSRSGVIAALTVLPVILLNSAHAQDIGGPPTSSSGEGSAITLPPVSVTAQQGDWILPPPFDFKEHPSGQPITTIGEDRFRDEPAFSIGDILRQSPGISVKQGNGPRDIGISIRGSNARVGFGIRNIQVFEDGFPITQPDGLSRTDLTDPHAYSRIDVYRGPSSAMFGNYATGGAINFHMRPGSEIRGAELGSDFGSFSYFNEYVPVGDQFGDYEYSLFASHVRGNGFQSNSSFTTTTGNILASYMPSLDDKITVKVIDNYLGTALPIRLSVNQFNLNPFQRGCLTPFSRSGCASVNLFANGLSGTTLAQTASQAGLGRQDQRTILGARWEHNFDAQTTWQTQYVYDNKDINQPTGATAALGDQPASNLMSGITQRGSFFGVPATHFAQVFFNYVHVSNDTYNVAPGGNARLGALTSYYWGHQYGAGARGREEVQFAPGWTGLVGVGVEYTDLQALNTINSFSSVGAPPTGSSTLVLRNYVNTAPEAALLYRPNDEWQLRGRVATGYGTPQVSNLFVTSQGVAGNNTQLQTQTNLGFDLGTDWAIADTLDASVTGFYELFQNEFVTQSPGAGLQSFTFNVPGSTHRGVELSADWRPVPGWRMTLAYLHDDQFYTNYIEQLSAGTKTTSFNRAGNKIPGVEPNDLFARLSYDQPYGPLAGVGAFIETYWRTSFFMDNANLVKAPGYALVNLNFHYDLSASEANPRNFRIYFEIQNLFNTTYIASANNVSDSISATTGLQNPASVVSGATGSIYAGAPRTFIGGIKMRF